MILLPDYFEAKLNTKPDLHGDVRKSLDLFEPWLEQSGMPFFPGFTDHSPRHINDVLSSAASLLSDGTRPLLSAEDIAVLSLAILLHDCGMHLTQDGFRALVTRNNPPIVSGLGDKPWHQIWTDFLSEASRFSEERLLAVFGDTEPVNISKLDINNLSERDCLLIGEFVRRHHARLAHEIAIDSVPMPGGNGLRLYGLDNELRDLAGLVARSHWLDIRASFPYLQSRFNRISEYRKVKTPFLMAVLRIADYVQVQSERALKALLSVKELRSPLSRQEWRNHFAVRDVTTLHEDPEAMYVHATPADVKTFLRLEGLFKDIQKELDKSWATIGEVYGRLGELSALGLTVRRLRSNLDDRERFALTVPYIPTRAGLQTSGPELLKLLVGPLYDYKPAIGIRELVQNAIDACREREDLVGEVSGEVLVEIDESDDGTAVFTVTDTGVGMTQSTITNYFLVAGASFRNSDLWKRQHTDASGRSRVLRGGRFGVGALSAFLLGEELTVQSRHIHSEYAIEFSAKIDEPVVELRRVPNSSIGTIIKIAIKDQAIAKSLRPLVSALHYKNLKDGVFWLERWGSVDWFAQISPRIIYKWRGKADVYGKEGHAKKEVVELLFKPSEDLVPHNADENWHSLSNPHPYSRILWQHPEDRKIRHGESFYKIRSPARVVVNGIRVQTLSENDFLRLEEENIDLTYSLQRPSLAIFDPAGLCPINLQRSAIAFGRMGIDKDLGQMILEKFLQAILPSLPKSLTFSNLRDFANYFSNQRGISFHTGLLAPVAATPTGIFLCTDARFAELKISRVYFLDGNDFFDTPIDRHLREGEALVITKRRYSGIQESLGWFRASLGSTDESWRAYQAGFPPLEHTAAFALVSRKTWSLAQEQRRVSRTLLSRVTKIDEFDSKIALTNKGTKISSTDWSRIKEICLAAGDQTEITCWDLRSQSDSPLANRSLLNSTWSRIVGGPLAVGTSPTFIMESSELDEP